MYRSEFLRPSGYALDRKLPSLVVGSGSLTLGLSRLSASEHPSIDCGRQMGANGSSVAANIAVVLERQWICRTCPTFTLG